MFSWLTALLKDVEKLNPITRIKNLEAALAKFAGEAEAWLTKQDASINKIATATGVDLTEVQQNLNAAASTGSAPTQN